MNFFPNYPVMPNIPVPGMPVNNINMPDGISNWMGDINNIFNRINEFENRIKKLEQRVINLENSYKNDNYQEPDNSLYMI